MIKLIFQIIISFFNICTLFGYLNINEFSSLQYDIDILNSPRRSEDYLLENENTVLLSSKFGQKYQCTIESPKKEIGKEAQPVIFKSIVDLLRPIEEGPCLQFLNGWWTYELCYKKFIRQFHQSNDKAIMSDVIYLGYFYSEFDWDDNSKQKDSMNTYHSQSYINGTVCDLTQEPRSAEVKIQCRMDSAESDDDIISFVEEPTTCKYVVTIETPRLCEHPLMRRKPDKKKFGILCNPLLDANQYEEYAQMKEMSRGANSFEKSDTDDDDDDDDDDDIDEENVNLKVNDQMLTKILINIKNNLDSQMAKKNHNDEVTQTESLKGLEKDNDGDKSTLVHDTDDIKSTNNDKQISIEEDPTRDISSQDETSETDGVESNLNKKLDVGSFRKKIIEEIGADFEKLVVESVNQVFGEDIDFKNLNLGGGDDLISDLERVLIEKKIITSVNDKDGLDNNAVDKMQDIDTEIVETITSHDDKELDPNNHAKDIDQDSTILDSNALDKLENIDTKVESSTLSPDYVESINGELKVDNHILSDKEENNDVLSDIKLSDAKNDGIKQNNDVLSDIKLSDAKNDGIKQDNGLDENNDGFVIVEKREFIVESPAEKFPTQHRKNFNDDDFEDGKLKWTAGEHQHQEITISTSKLRKAYGKKNKNKYDVTFVPFDVVNGLSNGRTVFAVVTRNVEEERRSKKRNKRLEQNYQFRWKKSDDGFNDKKM